MFNTIDVLLTSVSMSIDAMTVNVVNGISEKNIKTKKIILIAMTFGLFQFFMPSFSYLIGHIFYQYIEKAIPLIAFGLLGLLAIKSFIDWIKDRKCKEDPTSESCQIDKKITVKEVLVQGVATSIDALCIGITFLSYSYAEAFLAFGIIGVVTFALSFLTGFFSKKLAGKLEKWAGLIASIIFLAVGIKILLEGIL